MAVAAFAVLLTAGCQTSAPPAPTKERPLPMCSVTCKGRWMLERQLLCAGDRRFEDILVIGEHERRAADGTIMAEWWITDSGDYPKRTVIRATCSSAIQQIIHSRPDRERGCYPGDPLCSSK